MSSPGSGVAVVGSANMDIVFSVARAPQPGETLLAESAARYPGGKGLNQAVAAARAGSSTAFVGALGTDDAGDALSAVLIDSGISATALRRITGDTGQAFIVVDGRGENTIVVASGANALMTTLTGADRAAIGAASVLLMQLELPMPVILQAAAEARAAGTVVMLNAAPATALPDGLVELLDYLIVNEHEARLVGASESLGRASLALAARVPRVVVTLGSAGSALYDDGAEVHRIAAPPVNAVDTTGAGDTFCGAFASAIDQGRPFADAARFATAAAALSVQVTGAVPSVPSRGRIDELLGLM